MCKYVHRYILYTSVKRTGRMIIFNEISLLQRRLKAAAGVMTLLGTGWFIGVFMALPGDGLQIALQYLFILMNSTQVNYIIYAYYMSIYMNSRISNRFY